MSMLTFCSNFSSRARATYGLELARELCATRPAASGRTARANQNYEQTSAPCEAADNSGVRSHGSVRRLASWARARRFKFKLASFPMSPSCCARKLDAFARMRVPCKRPGTPQHAPSHAGVRRVAAFECASFPTLLSGVGAACA